MEQSPFKKACDACTKAKSKCNGKNPCQLCEKRGEACVYAFKRKRGPTKRVGEVLEHDPVEAKRQTGNAIGVAITPYERRLWTVFFTIFKNQENSYTDTGKRGLAWCWFARQLELLKRHCTKQQNQQLSEMIQSFLDSMNLKMHSVTSKLEKSCPFTPSMCVECASAVVSHPHKAPTFLSVSEGTLRMVSIEVPEGTHDIDSHPTGKFMSSLLAKHHLNETPAFVYKQTDSPSFYEVVPNASFVQTFSLDGAAANDLLSWSGNGFLPWAGDLVAKLIVSEADLITYLQIMCLKFQAMSVASTARAYIREVPSSHSFKFWVRRSDGAWHQQQCLMHCCHRVLKTPKHLSSHVVITIEIIGEPYEVDNDHSEPIASDAATASAKRQRVGSAEPCGGATQAGTCMSSDVGGQHTAATASAPYIAPFHDEVAFGVDAIPDEMLDYYSAWEQVESSNLGYSEAAPEAGYEAYRRQGFEVGSGGAEPAPRNEIEAAAAAAGLDFSVPADQQVYASRADFACATSAVEQSGPHIADDSNWLEQLLEWHDETGLEAVP